MRVWNTHYWAEPESVTIEGFELWEVAVRNMASPEVYVIRRWSPEDAATGAEAWVRRQLYTGSDS